MKWLIAHHASISLLIKALSLIPFHGTKAFLLVDHYCNQLEGSVSLVLRQSLQSSMCKELR